MKVFVTSKSFSRADGGAAERHLIEHGFTVERCARTNPTADDIAAGIGDADVLIVGNDCVDDQVLAAAPMLGLVMMHGTGLDAIDVEAASRRGILVGNVPGVNRNSVAELIVALMLMAGRRIPLQQQRLREGDWGRAPGHELSGATVGVLGVGSIGGRVVDLIRGFGCTVAAFDPAVDTIWAAARNIALRPDPAAVIAEADYLILALPLKPETRHIVDAAALATMKPGAVIVNAARGGLVDEAALAEAVSQGRIWGAALDVFAEEPLPADSPLRGTDIILTPHMAATSIESSARVSLAVAERIVAITVRGEHALAVNADRVASRNPEPIENGAGQ